VNPNYVGTEAIISDVRDAARVKGVQLQILKASTESEIDSAFTSLVQLQAGALVVSSEPFFTSRREQLAALASRYAIPAIYGWREFAAAGGLISYGPSLAANSRQAGIYEAVIQLRTWRPHSQYPSFPRKREPRDFSRLPLGPRFRGDDGLSCPQDFLTASSTPEGSSRAPSRPTCRSSSRPPSSWSSISRPPSRSD
jgi:hypothetical protein